MRLIFIALLLACAYATPQYTKTAGVKGGYGGHGYHHEGMNLVNNFYNNGSHHQGYGGYGQNLTGTGTVNYEIGVCYIEVPTATLVKDPTHVPAGNGSRPDLSRIRSCCSGYIRNIHNYRICDPVCNQECVNGLCSAPNTCTCFPDHVKNLAGFCIATCPIGCQNGQCSGGECICKDGYRLDSESKFCVPYCREQCGGPGRGNCTAPNTCECQPGYRSTPEGSCKPSCDRCKDGQCVGPNDCRCSSGYTKDQYGDCIPQCSSPCSPPKRCIAPNVCGDSSSPPAYNNTGSGSPYGRPPTYNPNQTPNNPYGQQPQNPNYPGHYQPNNPSNPSNTPGQQQHTYPSSPRPPGSQQNNQPGSQPSNYPGSQPSNYPGSQPSNYPGSQPSNYPGSQPSNYPGSQPSNYPGSQPSNYPGSQPSNYPSNQPSSYPGYRPPPTYPGGPQYPGHSQNNYPGGPYPGNQVSNNTSAGSIQPGVLPNTQQPSPYGQRPVNPSGQPIYTHIPNNPQPLYPDSQHLGPDHRPNPAYPSPNSTQGVPSGPSYPNNQYVPINQYYPDQRPNTNLQPYQRPNNAEPYYPNSQYYPNYNQQSYNQESVYQQNIYQENQMSAVELLCSIPCVNGTCVGRDVCSCNTGYVPIAGDTSRCEPYCSGCTNGVCVSPYMCQCHPGFYKDFSVKGRTKCVRRIRRSVDETSAPLNIAELLVFEIPDDYDI
ncbi:unnamed protein product [Spodoptera littoralis]|uniref:EGF-like domain-containing protein n=1 Tax=Spodoptera littoralis TaxID=7109 RepID=A0A9P0IHP3_SPOLI|nr:unnamed protein product [Spodoptera littoralis]CAH1646926.1 unnamed protein product [Spodoptera littoralis]